MDYERLMLFALLGNSVCRVRCMPGQPGQLMPGIVLEKLLGALFRRFARGAKPACVCVCRKL